MNGSGASRPPTRRLAALAAAGGALATSQALIVRELVSGLFGEEIVILLVNATLFAAISLGYWWAPRLTRTAVGPKLFVAGCLLHLSLPVLPRWGFALLDTTSAVVRLPFAVGLAACLLAPLATLLPRAVAEQEDRVAGMRWSYSAELAGFLGGLLVVHVSFGHPVVVLMTLHWILLGGVLALSMGRRPALAFAVPAALLLPSLPARAQAASTAVYRNVHGMKHADVVFSIDSPYQRVEVVDDGPGRRSLYLDGLENLNASDLALLNEYLAVIPARLMRPRRVLLVGNGTLSLVAPLLVLAEEVVTVELDPVVVETGRRFFSPDAGRGRAGWSLVETDGKAYLARSGETFDLIVFDVPSPLGFQEAFLHTREIYELARARLAPRGVVAVQLSGNRLGERGRSPSRVAASLAAVFEEVAVVESAIADRAFAYASPSLPFDVERVRDVMPPAETKLVVHSPTAVRRRIGDTRPLEVDSLDLVLRRGLERFFARQSAAGKRPRDE
ncbi:MAG: hypothetical protein KIT84_16605 [Labilithrix sp.]|nr:hypothetical protein [Labilithrix sp.]MCW5812652.1 hypothetical protein [Labilithrix sp.]